MPRSHSLPGLSLVLVGVEAFLLAGFPEQVGFERPVDDGHDSRDHWQYLHQDR